MESAFRETCPPDLKVIETFGAGSDGPAGWPPHHARLLVTCQRLGIDPDLAALDAIPTLRFDGPSRVRLTIDQTGQVAITSAPMAANPGSWIIAKAPVVLDATNPWRQVKTTHRAIYDDARAGLPAGVDELIFINGNGHLAEGTITNVFVEVDGILRTPPVSDGALPGILRAKMIADNRAEVGYLTWDDLVQSPRIYVGNSLRGLIPARVI